jgi:hypothetical protein
VWIFFFCHLRLRPVAKIKKKILSIKFCNCIRDITSFLLIAHCNILKIVTYLYGAALIFFFFEYSGGVAYSSIKKTRQLRLPQLKGGALKNPKAASQGEVGLSELYAS